MLKNILLFLIAAFSMTQIRIVGYIGIAELALLACGPFLLGKHWKALRRDGFAPFLVLAGLWASSAVVTDLHRENSTNNMLKGVAAPLVMIFATPCLYLLLRDDVRRIKWAIVGFTVTLFLSTYVMPSGFSVAMAAEQGISAREAAEEYKLTYMSLVLSVVSLVPMLAYWQVPTLSTLLTLGMAVFSLLQGGRSTFLGLLMSAAFLALIGGRLDRLKRLSRNMVALLVVLTLMGLGALLIYGAAVTHGYLGETELRKYELQKDSRIGLLSGRSHFVVAFYAWCDSPILGHGSWAIDYNGYEERALDWVMPNQTIKAGSVSLGWIPTHSHILGALVWHGLLGGIFWCYVLWLVERTVRYRLGVVPELFGYFAYTMPPMLWAILFSPFGGRVATITLLVVCLLARNIDQCRRRASAPARVT
jgi:hypothetical protein